MQDNFKYNPFAGIFSEDIGHILVPIFDIEEMVDTIRQSDSLAIEFLGRQGRGKTTHLTYLQQQTPEYPICFHHAHAATIAQILEHSSDIVFIDSIHHLSFKERVAVLKHKKVVIFTTHWTRKIECLSAKKSLKTIKFKGISSQVLTDILNKRLSNAVYHNSRYEPISQEEVKTLIQKYGDNYRGIINHLYTKYQSI